MLKKFDDMCHGFGAIPESDTVIYPDPQGGYNPPVFMGHPPIILSSKEVIMGCLWGVFV